MRWPRRFVAALVVGLVVALAPVVASAQILAGSNNRLVWDASPSSDVVSYRVYSSATSGGYTKGQYTKDVGAALEAHFPDLGLADGVYFFVVTAVDAHGNESAFSNEVHVDLDLTKPEPPANLQIGLIVAASFAGLLGLGLLLWWLYRRT